MSSETTDQGWGSDLELSESDTDEPKNTTQTGPPVSEPSKNNIPKSEQNSNSNQNSIQPNDTNSLDELEKKETEELKEPNNNQPNNPTDSNNNTTVTNNNQTEAKLKSPKAQTYDDIMKTN